MYKNVFVVCTSDTESRQPQRGGQLLSQIECQPKPSTKSQPQNFSSPYIPSKSHTSNDIKCKSYYLSPHPSPSSSIGVGRVLGLGIWSLKYVLIQKVNIRQLTLYSMDDKPSYGWNYARWKKSSHLSFFEHTCAYAWWAEHTYAYAWWAQKSWDGYFFFIGHNSSHRRACHP